MDSQAQIKAVARWNCWMVNSRSVYRISTAIPPSTMPGGFTFNQFLIDDDKPLLFHTGQRVIFQDTDCAEKLLVAEASAVRLLGTLYAPTAPLEVISGAALQATQLIVDQLKVDGGALNVHFESLAAARR